MSDSVKFNQHNTTQTNSINTTQHNTNTTQREMKLDTLILLISTILMATATALAAAGMWTEQWRRSTAQTITNTNSLSRAVIFVIIVAVIDIIVVFGIGVGTTYWSNDSSTGTHFGLYTGTFCSGVCELCLLCLFNFWWSSSYSSISIESFN